MERGFERPSGWPPELELQEVKKQLSVLIDLDFVLPSTSSFASPVLLVRKPGGSFHMCLDYRSVNAATHKNTYPIPRVDELFEQLTVFFKAGSAFWVLADKSG